MIKSDLGILNTVDVLTSFMINFAESGSLRQLSARSKPRMFGEESEVEN